MAEALGFRPKRPTRRSFTKGSSQRRKQTSFRSGLPGAAAGRIHPGRVEVRLIHWCLQRPWGRPHLEVSLNYCSQNGGNGTSPATAIGDSLAHVHVTDAPAIKQKSIFQALPAPLLAHKKPGLVSAWRRFCGEKPAIQGGHIKAHCASINDTGLNLFCSSQSPYISTTRHIYIYQSKKKNTHVIFVLNAKGCPPTCERLIPLP